MSATTPTMDINSNNALNPIIGAMTPSNTGPTPKAKSNKIKYVDVDTPTLSKAAFLTIVD